MTKMYFDGFSKEEVMEEIAGYIANSHENHVQGEFAKLRFMMNVDSEIFFMQSQYLTTLCMHIPALKEELIQIINDAHTKYAERYGAEEGLKVAKKAKELIGRITHD